MNTTIAKCANGSYYVDHESNGKKVYIRIDKDINITATYNTKKHAGVVDELLNFNTEVRSAISQKKVGQFQEHHCEVYKDNFVSPMHAVKSLTGCFFDGSLLDNARVLEYDA